jgi:OmcA/MtrC family decaheme c-type cytochrome
MRRASTRLGAIALLLAGSFALVSETKPPFTERDKAFWADEATVAFVRPGLDFRVLGHEITAEGVVRVRFRMTDARGVGLDRDGIFTPGPVSSSFILARIPRDGKFYEAYTTRSHTSTWAHSVAPGRTVRQASSDTGGRFESVGDGVYVYTFGTRLPAGFDRTATHTIGIFGNRNLAEFNLGTNFRSVEYHFVPDGAPPSGMRDVVSSASCNKCHTDINAHGGSRRGMANCVLCHAPGYGNVENVDPDTGNTLDMTVMTHRIHMGADLPSVQAGRPFRMVGRLNTVADFSHVRMPSGPGNCGFCHEQGPAQAGHFLAAPSRAACGSCHDDVNFATGEGHIGLPQFTDAGCARCHIPQGELDFDASILGAHVTPSESALVRGAKAKIVSVANTRPGERPAVTFTLTDRADRAMAIEDLIPGAGRGRLALTLAGPTTDYGEGIRGAGLNGFVTETVTVPRVTGAPGRYTYTFTTAIPAGSVGTWAIAVEGRTNERVLQGTLRERAIDTNIPNEVTYFSVDGSPVTPRRTIVTDAKCNQCHASLIAHGSNRDKVENCVICHNPAMTDARQRPAARMPAESIDMAMMIHRIHAGTLQTRDYTLFGFGGTAYNFNRVVLPMGPSQSANCSVCHVDGSYDFPVRAALRVTDPRGLLNPVFKASGACLGCHTSVEAASHALLNTSPLGESCGVCHGPNASQSVARVHAQ